MTPGAVKVAAEVSSALAQGRPVVALESSVFAQGLPPPHNLEAYLICERAVREAGAVPAVTAVVAGRPCAGLSKGELDRLVLPETGARKVGERDLAMAMASGQWGATTVSATCWIAAAVGIRLFATGGIGGVHRQAERTFDVSQDLGALARSRVAVVTAGAKAILDLPRTMEVLEALGVPVVGYRAGELPAFYTRSSGLALEHQVADAGEAAALLRARWDELGQGGLVFANPIPAAHQADPREVQRAIDEALAEASSRGIRGKGVTPFLLEQVARRTGGKSLQANLALLESNARVAAQIAVQYSAGSPTSSRGKDPECPSPAPGD